MEKNTNVEQTPLEKLVIDFFNNRITDMEFEKRISELYAEHSNSERIESNLKEFSLEAAKAGKPVYTRDGRKVRIICFDKKGDRSIVALIEEENNTERVGWYYSDGKYLSNGEESTYDLITFSEKKEGWVNIYQNLFFRYLSKIYENKEQALEARMDNCIDTVKIIWKE